MAKNPDEFVAAQELIEAHRKELRKIAFRLENGARGRYRLRLIERSEQLEGLIEEIEQHWSIPIDTPVRVPVALSR